MNKHHKLIAQVSVLSSLMLGGVIAPLPTSMHNNDQVTVQAAKKKYYFKKDTAKLRDLKIKIDKVRFLSPSEDGTTDKNMVVFEYSITNLSNKDIDAVTGWQAVFNAYQKNKDTEGKLEVGSTPSEYQDAIDVQTQKINKNGTVKCVTAYELADTKTPVVLKATKGFEGKKLGQKTYKIGTFEQAKDYSTESAN
ncbi:DUF5067 domain-containing protein [Loigolactobacillus binensis]|uniref:DUF5067 domain-containing protein n=1 Tax=Loigolactobacillus binensis TaxID=2559922 RepID=A0ABW3EDB1_9LACO|nr:DUF5067 domain-containing protein [Loigolactobacillus binensis]